MPAKTIAREDLFAVGTEVAAYALVSEGRTPVSGPPPGAAAATETVESDGTVTFTLDQGSYLLYAGSPDRYLRVNVFPAETAGGVSQEDVDSSIAAHAADTTNVHGISDTAFIKGVAVDLEGGVEARPDFLSVEFVQPDDPGELAEDGDTWRQTAGE